MGFHIASALLREGHDLVILERNPERVRALQSHLDVLAVEGDGLRPQRAQGAPGGGRGAVLRGLERRCLEPALGVDGAAAGGGRIVWCGWGVGSTGRTRC